MKYKVRVLTLAIPAFLCLFATAAPAQEKPGNAQPDPDHPPDAQPAQDHPTKSPKPKSRLNLLRQTQVDLDMGASRAHVDEKDRKKLDKCHEVLIDAIAQQQRYKSVNAGKVNGCLKDLDRLLDAGAFSGADRDKLLQDSQKLGESVGKPRRIHLPQPL
jgi:hypothetical protein